MTALKVRPLCGKCAAGWLEDEDGAIVGRCPCRNTATPEEARDEALTAVSVAHADAFRAAKQIIRETAAVMEFVSGNETRHRMSIAQVPRGIPGAAFVAAVREGILERVDTIQSDDPATRHRIDRYRSLIYRADQRAKAAGE